MLNDPTIIAYPDKDGRYSVPSGGLAAPYAEELTTTCESLSGVMRLAAANDLLKGEAKEAEKTAIIIKKSLIDVSIGKDGALAGALSTRYRTMVQGLKKVFAADDDSLFKTVDNDESVAAAVTELTARGIKTIVLDDGTFSSSKEAEGIAAEQGKYCVVSAQLPLKQIDDTFAFVNLNAMAMIGRGVLLEDQVLFEYGYEAFTGNKCPAGILESFANRVLWIIRAIPRVVRLTEELRQTNELHRLFEIAA